MTVAKSSLSLQRKWLLTLMQEVNFGRFENLSIRKGEPIVDSPPRIFCEVKFGGENGPRQELCMADFMLKSQVVELFAYFDKLQNGTIDVLEIKHGLPFRMIVEDKAA